MKSRQTAQQGSFLIVAIFIILILSLIGLATLAVLNRGAESVVAEVYGARAYQAARSGSQIMLAQLFPLGQEGAATDACTGAVQSYDFNNNSPGLTACTARVTCRRTEFNEYSLQRFIVEATGSCQAGSQFYSRSIIVEAFDEAL